MVIESAQPLVDGGRFPAKGTMGVGLTVSADVFSHGHDLVRASLRYRKAGGRRWSSLPMAACGNDRFAATVMPSALGTVEIEIFGCTDELSTWLRDARRRVEAGRPDAFEGDVGAGLLEEAAAALAGSARAEELDLVLELASRARAGVDLALLDEADFLGTLFAMRPSPSGSPSVRLTVNVARPRAGFSTWYELFPRSSSPKRSRPGTLRDVVERLDYVAQMGFDVLYLPPIHPIGVTARKGKGNAPVAKRGDVGSPWAIGSAAGGHTAVAPELGTIGDLDDLVAAAAAHGIELALDLAFQLSPDHPWVTEHPEWLRHRLDGTIACAENPPKRYDDIYPIDFQTADREGLWTALLGVVRFWMGHGVRIFRVDNPHTKPFAFWEWMIAEAKREQPEVIFLAEAFTRPRVMHRLAKVGFDQSYTYFTWRYEKWDLTEYFTELAHGPGASYFRPNVWPNTPDILGTSLQHAPRPSFVARLVLAAGLSANYGIYGPVFELGWNTPQAAGSEEYARSEKYQVHHHNLDDPMSLRDVIARVNSARHAHPALQRNDGLVFLPVDNDQLIAWSKHDPQSDDIVVGVVNLDPEWAQSGFVDLDPALSAAGLTVEETGPIRVRDLLSGDRYRWQRGRNYVKLDPARAPAHLLALERSR